MDKILNLVKKNFVGMDIFNFLRGIALLCVIGIHTVCVIGPAYPEIQCSNIYRTPAWMSMWIFIFLSGYLLGKGFYKGKYQTDNLGILKFYISRFIRIVPMYLLFLFILFLFYNPIWFITNPHAVFQLLTFRYNGVLGIAGVGALWFVSVIVQLYILAPIVYKYILSKFNKYDMNKITCILVFIIILGFSYRQIIKHYRLDYWICCMTSSLCNLDLFFGGMLLNAITAKSKDDRLKRFLRPVSVTLLFFMIFSYMQDTIKQWIYVWVCPTLILITMILIVYSFDFANGVKPAPLTIKSMVKNPLRFIEYLGVISFTFYLYHSNIIEIAMKILKDDNFPFYVDNMYLYRYTFILMFVLTFILSVVMHYILEEPCNILRNKLMEKIKPKISQ